MVIIGDNPIKRYKIGLYEDGSSCYLLSDGSIASQKTKPPVKLVNNFIFRDTLKLTGTVQKCNTINFIFKSQTNNSIYNMFHTNLLDTLTIGIMEKGIIFGNWSFVKKGPGIGLIKWVN